MPNIPNEEKRYLVSYETKELGNRLKAARKAAKMTQKELGSMLGVSATAIMRYEKGERRPSVLQLARLAGALSCDFLWLVGSIVIIDDTKSAGKMLEEAYMALNSGEDDLSKALDVLARAFGGYDATSQIISFFDKLNDTGKQEAIKRIKELTHVEEYTRKESDHASTDDEEAR